VKRGARRGGQLWISSLYNSRPVAQRVPLWKTKARLLEKAEKQFREKSPDGIHDLRVALRRVSATASALGRGKLARQSKKLVRSLSDLRQIEVDRQLLARIRKLGWLPEEVAAGVDARWDAILRDGEKAAARRVPDDELGDLRRKLGRLSRKRQEDLLARLEKAQRKAEQGLARIAADGNDESLHRYRLAVKEARYLAEDLVLAGQPGLEAEIERKKKIQDALGRWNDLRLFRHDLLSTRDDAERRGAVTFVLELDRLVAALEPAVLSARKEAVRVAGVSGAKPPAPRKARPRAQKRPSLERPPRAPASID
jgi:CHAD domain-containing protein